MTRLLLLGAALALCAVLPTKSLRAGDCEGGNCGSSYGGQCNGAYCGPNWCDQKHINHSRCVDRRAQYWAYDQSLSLPWHNAYYHAAYGEPYALVVPPTAEYQSNYGWGTGGTRVGPIYHQFARPYPGDAPAAGGAPTPGFLPTPPWPSDTTQFGVYYIRGPW